MTTPSPAALQRAREALSHTCDGPPCFDCTWAIPACAEAIDAAVADLRAENERLRALLDGESTLEVPREEYERLRAVVEAAADPRGLANGYQSCRVCTAVWNHAEGGKPYHTPDCALAALSREPKD